MSAAAPALAAPAGSAATAAAGSGRHLPLQYLRAAAACCVLLYHAGFYVQHYAGDGRVLAVFGDGLGRFGVLVFFALSGLLMAVQARRMANDAPRFLLHRVVRIYPAFWLACLLQAAALLLLGDTRQLDPLTLMLAPLGPDRAYVLGVEWTLVYELGFYLAVGALVLLRLGRHVALAGGCWLLVIVVLGLLRSEQTVILHTGAAGLLLSSSTAAFAAGLLLEALPRRAGAFSPVQAALLLGFAAGWGFWLLDGPGAARIGATAAATGCACLVAWVSGLPARGPRALSWLARLGDWSFALYLVHVPVLMLLLPRLPEAGPLLLALAGVAAALVAGALLGMADLSLHRVLRGACDRLRPGWRVLACGLFLAAFAGSVGLARQQAGDHRRLPPALNALREVGKVEDVPDLLARAGFPEDPALTGSLDVFRRGRTGLSLEGWTSDPADWRNRSRLLVVVPGHGVILLPPRNYRMDLLSALGEANAAAPVGFQRMLDGAACPPGRGALLVFLSLERRVSRVVGRATCPDGAE